MRRPNSGDSPCAQPRYRFTVTVIAAISTTTIGIIGGMINGTINVNSIAMATVITAAMVARTRRDRRLSERRPPSIIRPWGAWCEQFLGAPADPLVGS
jgi:hypothetical protein